MKYTWYLVLVLVAGVFLYGTIDFLLDELHTADEKTIYYAPHTDARRASGHSYSVGRLMHPHSDLSDVAVKLSPTRSGSLSGHAPRVYTVPKEVMAYARAAKPFANTDNPRGLYLTSSAQVHSYGSGTPGSCAGYDAGLKSNRGETASYAGSYSKCIQRKGGDNGAQASAANSTVVSTFGADGSFATAGSRFSAPGRRRLPGMSIEDTYYNWLHSDKWGYGGVTEVTLISESELRALYDALCADNGDFAETHTYDQFLAWFMSKQDDEQFLWKFPVGDAPLFLAALCLIWGIYMYKRNKKHQTA
ncbi:MAG: hypothetical protein ACI30A_00240 [Paludibacteraceae bacterium]